MLEVIAGYDPQDTTSIDAPVPDYSATIAATTSSLRLGIPRAYFYRRPPSRDSSGHGGGSLGPENDYRLRAGGRAAFDGRYLLILDGSLHVPSSQRKRTLITRITLPGIPNCTRRPP